MKRVATCFVLMTIAGAAWADVKFAAGPSLGSTLGPNFGAFGSVVERAAVVWGGQVTAGFTDALSLEFSVLHFRDWDEEERFGVKGTGRVGITPLALSLRYAVPLPVDGLRAYGLAGAAWYNYETIDLDIEGDPEALEAIAVTSDPEIKMKDVLGFHTGAGLEWDVWNRATLFCEYRFAWIHNRASISGLHATTPEGAVFIHEVKGDFTDNDELPIARIGLNYWF